MGDGPEFLIACLNGESDDPYFRNAAKSSKKSKGSRGSSDSSGSSRGYSSEDRTSTVTWKHSSNDNTGGCTESGQKKCSTITVAPIETEDE
jgi:hypothetical protein